MPVRIFDREYSARKNYEQGTHRTRAPAETYERLKASFARFGITRVANLTGLDTIDIPVYTAIRPNSRSLATSQGKGLDRDAARVSAVMESIEAWHAEHIAAPVRIESYSRLRRIETVVDIENLHCVRPPSDVLPYSWMLGYDIIKNERCWVPYDGISMNRVVEPGSMSDFLPSSNGLASGNHLLEAVVHALCEVIERDATALWQLGGASDRVDLEGMSDAYCHELVARIHRGGAFAAAWDITSDIAIPTYVALVTDHPDTRFWRRLGVAYGVGTHLSPSIALSRALTEAVQSRVGFISGSRDDIFRSRHRSLSNDDFVQGVWKDLKEDPPTAKLGDRTSLAQPTFEADVGVLLQWLQKASIKRAVVVDLTQEGIDIPVVKVVVPGLEGPGLGEQPGARAAVRVSS
jgi:YcaO-like protein with predicted kinase domain